MNKLIAIEGIDGSGKATQSKLLAKQLKAKLFSFPNYETETGQMILGNLTEKWGATATRRREIRRHGDQVFVETQHEAEPRLNAVTLQSIFATNRYEAAHDIEAALETQHVVLDRYWPSGWVYGVCDGLDGEWLLRIHERLPQPDVMILIDVPPEASVERRPERRDRYEKDANMSRRRGLYRDLWAVCDRPHWIVVDGTGTVAEVQACISTKLQKIIGGSHG